MSGKDKLFKKARTHPASLTFAELAKFVGFFGYEQTRQKGSHRIFSRGKGFRRFNFQENAGMAKIAQVRQFLDYAEEMRWFD